MRTAEVRIDPAQAEHCMRLTRIRFARELLRFEQRRLVTSPPGEVFVRLRSFEEASARYLQAVES